MTNSNTNLKGHFFLGNNKQPMFMTTKNLKPHAKKETKKKTEMRKNSLLLYSIYVRSVSKCMTQTDFARACLNVAHDGENGNQFK